MFNARCIPGEVLRVSAVRGCVFGSVGTSFGAGGRSIAAEMPPRQHLQSIGLKPSGSPPPVHPGLARETIHPDTRRETHDIPRRFFRTRTQTQRSPSLNAPPPSPPLRLRLYRVGSSRPRPLRRSQRLPRRPLRARRPRPAPPRRRLQPGAVVLPRHGQGHALGRLAQP